MLQCLSSPLRYIMPKVTIRVHIFSYITVLVTLLVLLFAGMQYYFSKEMALEATQKSFHLISTNISTELTSGDALSKEVIYQMQNFPDIVKPMGKKLNMKLVKRYVFTLKRLNNVVAMYSAQGDKAFIEVFNIKMSHKLQNYFEVPENTYWLAYTIMGEGSERAKRLYYLDENLKTIETRKVNASLMPTTRPWYKMAMKSEKVVQGAPYLFKTLQEKGITYSKRVDNSNVVIGLDLSLGNIKQTLDSLRFSKTSELLLFGSDGTIIASTDAQSSFNNDLITTFLKNPQTHRMNMPLKDTSRFAMVSRISEGSGYDSYLGVSVSKDEMLEPYIEKILFALYAVLALLVVSVPFTLLATNLIVRPIYAVMKENRKIRERDFENVVEVRSNIKELNRLSHSLLDMSQSIHAYQVAQKELMDGFIKLIADAIDAKSPYTAGHCQRVPLIAVELVKEASRSDREPFKDFAFKTPDEFEEFERGAWLHDCGKITTPEYVVDKATKLETIYNRIHEVRMRFEVLWRDLDIELLERQLNGDDAQRLETWREIEREKLIDDFAFIAECNIGGEFMGEERKERLKQIAKMTWTRHFDNRVGLSENELMRYAAYSHVILPVEEPLLRDKPEHIIKRIDFDEAGYRAQGFKLEVPEYLYNYGEVYNLCIERGTLSEEERFKIQEHVIMSIKMLEQLPYTEEMKRIPEYAGTHHETLIATGYPRALGATELSIPARIMAIADIFEALTASDRPYKKGKTLSEALKIMSFMVKDQHLDADLFRLFLESGVYMEYAKAHLKNTQLDEVEIEAYL